MVNDSKQLSPLLREELFSYISEIAISIGVGFSDAQIIDRRGIVKATRLAMKKAVDQLLPEPDFFWLITCISRKSNCRKRALPTVIVSFLNCMCLDNCQGDPRPLDDRTG